MRKLLLLACAVLLLPAGAAAQKSGGKSAPPVQGAPRTVDMSARITQAGARNVALGQARLALLKGANPCCDRMNPRTLRVVASSDVIVKWRYLYQVAVETPGVMSHMRVLVDPKTGGLVDIRQGRWPWTLAPSWWKRGLNEPDGRKE